MGLVAEKPFCSPEDYLRQEETGEIKHEYVDGEIYAMSGASRRHNMTAINTTLRLKNQAKGSGCEAYTSDVKVYIEAQTASTTPTPCWSAAKTTPIPTTSPVPASWSKSFAPVQPSSTAARS